jgi:hypothetical protein
MVANTNGIRPKGLGDGYKHHGEAIMTATILIPQSRMRRIPQLQCSGCGAEVEAACACGLSYVPGGVAAAKAIEANPEKSDRAIAKAVGVHHDTVRQARKLTGGYPPV